jgi:hypothetical protein
MRVAKRQWQGVGAKSLKAVFTSLFMLALAATMAASDPAAAQSCPCGTRPNDWCPAPAGDPCGRHRTVDACRADPACHGVPYRGESLVACKLDARGFASNCPMAGCTSSPPRPAGR